MNLWWQNWLKISAMIFLSAFMVSTLVHGIFFGPWGASILVGAVFGAIGAFGMSFFLVRDLKRETLEITSANKDSRKSMKWYEDEILSYLMSQRYKELTAINGVRQFTPRSMSQHMGGLVELESTTFSITLTAPRGTVRILASILDLKKIFL
jgi:hypothetical protein